MSPQHDTEQIPTIKSLILAFIDTLKTRDRAFMSSCLLPGFTATLIRDGTILHLDKPHFLDRFPWTAKEDIEEVLTNIDVKVYQDIAVVWAPFYTLRDGVVMTRGVNVVMLVKVDGGVEADRGAGGGAGVWKVSAVSDTSASVAQGGE